MGIRIGISSYAKNEVGYAVEAGFIQGYADGSFNPKGVSTREEVAKIAILFLSKRQELESPTATARNGAPIIVKEVGDLDVYIPANFQLYRLNF